MTLSEELMTSLKRSPNNIKLLNLLDKVKVAEKEKNVDALLLYRRQFEKILFQEKMLKVALSTLQGLGVSKVFIEEGRFIVNYKDNSTLEVIVK